MEKLKGVKDRKNEGRRRRSPPEKGQLGKWRALRAQHPHHTYYGTNSKKNLEERGAGERKKRAVFGVVSDRKRGTRDGEEERAGKAQQSE